MENTEAAVEDTGREWEQSSPSAALPEDVDVEAKEEEAGDEEAVSSVSPPSVATFCFATTRVTVRTPLLGGREEGRHACTSLSSSTARRGDAAETSDDLSVSCGACGNEPKALAHRRRRVRRAFPSVGGVSGVGVFVGVLKRGKSGCDARGEHAGFGSEHTKDEEEDEDAGMGEDATQEGMEGRGYGEVVRLVVVVQCGTYVMVCTADTFSLSTCTWVLSIQVHGMGIGEDFRGEEEGKPPARDAAREAV